MDQKATATLDPKLKEVYDRVMGTSTQPSPPITAAPSGQKPNNIQPVASAPITPTAPPSPAIGITPPINSAAIQSTPKDTLPPLPEKPLNAAPFGAPTPPNSNAQKPTVDYAAIAAKYATPLPSIGSTGSTQQAAVTPSSTTYGVVNNGSTPSTNKDSTAHTEKSNSSLKKILLIVGIQFLSWLTL